MANQEKNPITDRLLQMQVEQEESEKIALTDEEQQEIDSLLEAEQDFLNNFMGRVQKKLHNGEILDDGGIIAEWHATHAENRHPSIYTKALQNMKEYSRLVALFNKYKRVNSKVLTQPISDASIENLLARLKYHLFIGSTLGDNEIISYARKRISKEDNNA